MEKHTKMDDLGVDDWLGDFTANIHWRLNKDPMWNPYEPTSISWNDRRILNTALLAESEF